MMTHYDTPEMYADKIINAFRGHNMFMVSRDTLLERSPEMMEGSEFEMYVQEMLLDQGVLMYQHPVNGNIYFVKLDCPVRDASMIK